jgi:phosphoribosylamine-glycine ligase
MPRVTGDFARYLKSAADGAVEFDAAGLSNDACVGVSLVTKAYPYENTPLGGLPAAFELPPHVAAFWGTSIRAGDKVSSPGGRVLTIAARAATVDAARTAAYDAITQLKGQFPAGTPLTFRSDIAKLA